MQKQFIQQYTQQDVEVIDRDIVFDGFYQMQSVKFRHRLFSGEMSDVVTRELLIKKSAAAVLAYDPKADSVVLIEQIRIGAVSSKSASSPWLLELIAGMIEDGEQAEDVAIRESREEAGITLRSLQHIISFWDSPGGMVERIHLFVGLLDSRHVGGVYGLAEEHEDIKVHIIPRKIAYHWLLEGKIDNAITIIGLQWLELNYPRLQQQWKKCD
ncbi:ADP-ribose diphosphatase [Mergibacter septicus]|uniref:ADP-ribose pyrophosphatase n=1 Tax=Mergibacter septicus TaxID=221402 RepID=A0A8E3MC10_9PAST|nr:ADP-ribose diphosphatase [Mergibacter septicus]AWX15979.1 ADP-ribose diphosphatase [Mergibacter septicus]QDJ12502.1 ADP-ribose diphosphatase [Mergibacter septicus]QDJ15232.1 ADP-ribose diphosphatase [Mergibacter septicus]UTU47350.1 ADP-ribose diphosphatase [Mergibacter septicus]WMR95472.1 ADP-ribose diphosphatase [Mergibacter septicus]